MRPYDSLRREADFARIRRRGRRIEMRHFRLWALACGGDGEPRPPRVGLVSSKAVGN
ncbi:MAG: ribonuclease P protein component, partial [Candidatus Eremiobacteraeota bacterium]|nr:ribonuclease P protein component [Candidatus Eremiobacteraeota bacterium]